MGIQIVGDQGGRQVSEVELENGGDAVDVVEHVGIPRKVRNPLLVEEVPNDEV